MKSRIYSYDGAVKTGKPNWSLFLNEALRKKAFKVVQVLAERLSYEDRVLATLDTVSPYARFSPTSLFSGYSGLALAFLMLSRSHVPQAEEWGACAHYYLKMAAQATHQRPFVYPGLAAGSSGLASVVSLFAASDDRYQKTLYTLTHRLAEQVLEKTWKRETFGVSDTDYDVIHGASGIVGYLVSLSLNDPLVNEAIESLLSYLVWLIGEDETQKQKRWFISPEYYAIPELDSIMYPNGYLNLGLSHGIPGPLATLSVAWIAGYRVPGMEQAIREVSDWIVTQRIEDRNGISWPRGVAPADDPETRTPAFTAWCYGAPGVTRSLWLAGQALRDDALCHMAITGIESALRLPPDERGINSPTFCHGIAGLLHICLRFANETSSVLIREQIPLLVEQLLDVFDPAFPFGFRDHEKRTNTSVDDPGLLTGVAGIILVLLAATTPHAPQWDRIFLIA